MAYVGVVWTGGEVRCLVQPQESFANRLLDGLALKFLQRFLSTSEKH